MQPTIHSDFDAPGGDIAAPSHVPPAPKRLSQESMQTPQIVHDIQARILPNGTIGRDYSSHTSSESLKSLDFKSNW